MNKWKDNEIEDETYGLVVARVACNVLRINKETRLNLRGINESKLIEHKSERNKWINGWIDEKIGVEGVRILAEALKCNSSLTDMDLSCDEKNKIIWRIKVVNLF